MSYSSRNHSEYLVSILWSIPVVVAVYMLLILVFGAKYIHIIYLLKVLSLSLCFTLFAVFIYQILPIFGLAIAFSLLLIVLFGAIPGLGAFMYWSLASLIGIYKISQFRKLFFCEKIKLIIPIALTIILVTIPYFSFEYSQPNNEYRLLNSQLHNDFLYHTAIAAMIKSYSTISHGLSGLGALEYHFGSHIFLAMASRLLGVSVFNAYSYIYVFLCVPLLIATIIGLSEELLPSKNFNIFYGRLFFLIFFFLGTGILRNDSVLANFAVWNSFYISESYLLSLIFLMATLSILLANGLSKNILMISVLVFTAITTLTKISTGFFSVAIVGAWALFSRGNLSTLSLKPRLMIVLMCGGFCLLLTKIINPGGDDVQYRPMQFINTYVNFHGDQSIKIILFLLLQFTLPIFALFLFSIHFFQERKIIAPVWLMVSILFSGFFGAGILFLFYVVGGSGWYFANVSMFIALPVVLTHLGYFEFNSNKFLKFILVILVSLFLIYAPKTILEGSKNFLAQIRQIPRETSIYPFLKMLNAIREDPKSINSVVYIPRAESSFWKSVNCRSAGFIIPAISERPALYAWPSSGCYEFLCGPRFHSNGYCDSSQKAFDDDELLREAINLGFKSVEIITSSGIRRLQ